MKIGIDIRSTTNENRTRGIGVYTANLVEALAAIDSDNYYTLISQSDETSLRLPKHHTLVKVPKFNHPVLDRLYTSLVAMPRLRRYSWDVFLQPDLSYGLPRSKATVGVVYDFIELDFPAPVPTGLKQRLGWQLRRQIVAKKFAWLKKASALIAISDYTAAEVKRRFSEITDQPIHAIPLGVKREYFQPSQDRPDLKLTKPFFLYVGGGDKRKNVTALIEAFNQLPSSIDANLVLVGGDFTNQTIREQQSLRQQIRNSPFAQDIICTGYLPEAQVIWLYQHAAALTFPSLAEGFGLEIVEAMAGGCPVICYNNSALTEVAQAAAIMVNNQEELTAAMTKIITEPALAQNLINKGRAKASHYSWEKTAATTLDFLTKVTK